MKQAERRKYHYIYKITRVDGKYYIGMHSTDDLDDGYFGSGQRLWKSIKKHGKDKHTKEIIEFLPDRDTLKSREKELVNEEMLGDKLCMNLRLGGEGWESPEASMAGIKGNQSLNRDRVVIARKILATKRERNFANWFGGKHNSFEGLKHTPETKQKIGNTNSVLQSGEGNSQFGTCWVRNQEHSIKIQRTDFEAYINRGYMRGRKML